MQKAEKALFGRDSHQALFLRVKKMKKLKCSAERIAKWFMVSLDNVIFYD